ncbi:MULTISPECIES: sigma-54-dependent Fis family transcriptional regulator [Pseudonocardia]|uniref:Acetoin dehydrogenase operon transcriptional activator AcoR n=2 Tax=Pseudonocardia TaxID=1847 RepID=A0A1Y2N0B7_PSEAH|nr:MULTISPECIES: helix-turn-helix domain-containing protein [Pseudonocardia]OSY40741.1 Acetoin dehydrogenase operon transcriptional activator AcoR [Pseudonocardia autotrophica]TDN71952.1 transcriptional regulator of acetoin/glycerol metabolism [Pseudonocardia autotrophica]BBG02639.1 siderophore-interacting protein [Pseudonocardia autotrophica]GEC24698.1 siderophore-interacting protein [Pseudonocardia saturnea]
MTPARDDIAASWHRARIAGVDPAVVDVRPTVGVDRSSRLQAAAEPVLRALIADLADEPFSVQLADENCHIVQIWSGNRLLDTRFEEFGLVVGARLDEQTAGTNGIGTAFEVGHGFAIHGEEHYLAGLKDLSCYGHPIRHPLRSRTVGVLDITIADRRAHPLFAPLLSRAARDIEERIVEAAREPDRRLFLAFQEATRRRTSPIAVLGTDVVLTNRSAMTVLGDGGMELLTALRAEVVERGSLSRVLEVPHGGGIRVQAETVADTSDGVLFHLAPVSAAADHPGRGRAPATPFRSALIAGEPGSGRSTAAARLLGAGSEPVVVRATDAITGPSRHWAARLAALVEDGVPAVVVDDVHVLPEDMCTVLHRLLDDAGSTRIVLTSCPVDELPVPIGRTVARCTRRVELAPLRERRHEIADLVREMALDTGAGRELILTRAVVEALSAQAWPGNLNELAALVEHLVTLPGTRRIDVADLPERYRVGRRTTRLRERERSERVAIQHCLISTGGNKLEAARILGISRTTLYRRMQALDVRG